MLTARLVAMVLIVSTIVAGFCLPVQAAQTAQDVIYEAMSNRRDSVNLIAVTCLDPTTPYFQVYYGNPQFFYYSTAFSYSMLGPTAHVNTMSLKFTMASGDIDAAIREYNAMLSNIVSAMPSGLDNVGKVIWIHEYIASAYEYDYTYYIYDAYNLMKEGTGVCDAYSLLMIALLKSQGIECCYRFSERANHSWVAVKLDGQWYNVDPTWDDPSMGATDSTAAYTYSEGAHKYLLVSDATMLQRDGNSLRADANSYGMDISCTSTKYDNAFWTGVEGLMATLNGKWYYIDGDQYGKDRKALVENTVSQGETKRLSMHTEYWRPQDNPNAYYQGTYSGIGVYNGRLYVNTPRDVAAVDITTGAMTIVYTIDGANSIYRSEIIPGSKYITLYIDNEPYSSTYEERRLDLSQLIATTPTPTPKPTATPTPKPTATPTPKPTATPAAKPTATPAAKPTATPTATPTVTPTATPTATATPGTKPTATPAPSHTETTTATPAPVITPTAAPVATPTPDGVQVQPTVTPEVDMTTTPEPQPTTGTMDNPTQEPEGAGTSLPADGPEGSSSGEVVGSDIVIGVVIASVIVIFVGAALIITRKRGDKTT